MSDYALIEQKKKFDYAQILFPIITRILCNPNVLVLAINVAAVFATMHGGHAMTIDNIGILLNSYTMCNLVTFHRCIGELFLRAIWLPLRELNRNLCKERLSSELKLSFYQEYIIRILSALLAFVWSMVNKC